MISGFFLLAIVAIISVLLKSAWLKGVIGEYRVNTLIENRLDKKHYTLFKDVLLPTEDGTTQIDHIVLSKYGIFVIETKNISNWIFANTGPFWTQKVFKKNFKFQNPTRQNYKHVKVLEKLLGVEEKKIFNTVVFAGKCEFKTDVQKGVVKLSSLLPFIKSFHDQIISEEKLRNYSIIINRNKLENTFVNKFKHVQHVNSIIIDKGHEGFDIEKTFKKYSYKIIYPLVLILILFSMLDEISKQSSKMFSGIVKNNIELQNKTKQKQQTLPPQQVQQNPSQYASMEPRQTVGSSEYQNIKPKEPTKYRSAIYSWTNERGQRVFSNVGLPKDKQYTDPKIEWH